MWRCGLCCGDAVTSFPDTEESTKRCYMWVDLHVKNSVVVISDGVDTVTLQRRFHNDLLLILMSIESNQVAVYRLAVEPTSNFMLVGRRDNGDELLSQVGKCSGSKNESWTEERRRFG